MHGTAELLKHMDLFFDSVNVRNQGEGHLKRQPFLEPYRKVDDLRFKWLREEFLSYFKNWKDSIKIEKGTIVLLRMRKCLFRIKHMREYL